MTLKTDNYQIGLDSVTDSKNYLLDTDITGALRIRRNSDGSGATVFKVNFDNTVEFPTAPGILTKLFTSSDQTITAASLLTIPHGLGVVPLLYSVTLKCIGAELGYSINDVLAVNVSGDLGSTSSQWALYHDATNINIRIGASSIVIPIKGTGAASTANNANWRMIVRAWA